MYQSSPPQPHLHTDIQRRDTPRSWTCPTNLEKKTTKSAGFYISNHLSNLGSEISEFATRCDDNLVAGPGCGRIRSVPVTYPVGSPFGVSSVGETCEKRGIKVGLSKNCFVCHLHLANWTSRMASPFWTCVDIRSIRYIHILFGSIPDECFTLFYDVLQFSSLLVTILHAHFCLLMLPNGRVVFFSAGCLPI